MTCIPKFNLLVALDSVQIDVFQENFKKYKKIPEKTKEREENKFL
jgi:hypothetical protein